MLPTATHDPAAGHDTEEKLYLGQPTFTGAENARPSQLTASPPAVAMQNFADLQDTWSGTSVNPGKIGLVSRNHVAPLNISACPMLSTAMQKLGPWSHGRHAACDDRWVADGARERREAIRQLADLRRRLAVAEEALVES